MLHPAGQRSGCNLRFPAKNSQTFFSNITKYGDFLFQTYLSNDAPVGCLSPAVLISHPLASQSARVHSWQQILERTLGNHLFFFCFPPRCADFILYIIPGWTCWPPCSPRLHTPRILVSNLQKKCPPPSFRFSLFLCGKLSVHFNITHS